MAHDGGNKFTQASGSVSAETTGAKQAAAPRYASQMRRDAAQSSAETHAQIRAGTQAETGADTPNGPRDRTASHRARVAWVLAMFAVALLVGAFFALPRYGLMPFSAEHWTADWRTALLAPAAPAQRSDVVLITINEKTLAPFPYVSPLDRGLLSDIVEALDGAGARAIGFDIIFDRATEPEKDTRLEQALKSARAEIVLAQLKPGKLTPDGFAYQQSFLERVGRSVGHPHFPLESARFAIDEDTIRTLPSPIDATPSLSAALAAAALPGAASQAIADPDQGAPSKLTLGSGGAQSAGPNWLDGPGGDASARPTLTLVWSMLQGIGDGLRRWAFEPSDVIAWQRRPEDGSDLFRTLPAETLLLFSRFPDANPAKAALLGPLKGAIVLVGGDFKDRDIHATPLSIVTEAREAGLRIQAQVVAQRISGRSISQLTPPVQFIVLLLVGAAGVWMGWRTCLKRFELLIGIVGSILLIGADFLLYGLFETIVPLNMHWQLWALGMTAGHFIARYEGGGGEAAPAPS